MYRPPKRQRAQPRHLNGAKPKRRSLRGPERIAVSDLGSVASASKPLPI